MSSPQARSQPNRHDSVENWLEAKIQSVFKPQHHCRSVPESPFPLSSTCASSPPKTKEFKIYPGNAYSACLGTSKIFREMNKL